MQKGLNCPAVSSRLLRPLSHAGVVYGWDKECERDSDWAASVQADPNQPFYHVLPDEGEPDLPIVISQRLLPGALVQTSERFIHDLCRAHQLTAMSGVQMTASASLVRCASPNMLPRTTWSQSHAAGASTIGQLPTILTCTPPQCQGRSRSCYVTKHSDALICHCMYPEIICLKQHTRTRSALLQLFEMSDSSSAVQVHSKQEAAI